MFYLFVVNFFVGFFVFFGPFRGAGGIRVPPSPSSPIFGGLFGVYAKVLALFLK